MRTASLLIWFVCFSPPAAGQQTVAVDIIGLYDGIPTPPASLQEAYARAGCAKQPKCDVDKAYEPIGKRLSDVAAQIEIALAAASQPEWNALQGMSPEEIQKKLQSMSRDEQLKFAMEISTQQTAVPKQEPPSVNSAVAEMAKIRERMGRETVAGGGSSFADKHAALLAELERKHGEADAWATDARHKDSQGLPGPGWEKAQIDALEKHVAAEEAYQQALLIAFREEKARLKANFAPFQKKLAAIRYGEDAVNSSTRFNLVGIQQMMLRASEPLLDASRTATRSGADWWKRHLEQDRP